MNQDRSVSSLSCLPLLFPATTSNQKQNYQDNPPYYSAVRAIVRHDERTHYTTQIYTMPMQIDPGDIVNAEVRKADAKQKAGLELIETHDGEILVKKADGLFKRRNIPIEIGDRIVQIFGKDVEDFEGGLEEINELIKSELKIWLKFERMEGELPGSDDEEEESADEPLMLEDGEDQEWSDEEEEHELLTNGDTKASDQQIIVETVGDEDSADDIRSVATFESEDDDDEDTIRSGKEFRIFKYKKSPKLNGTIVRALKPSGNRKLTEKNVIWEVELLRHPLREIDEGLRISISEENLRPIF